ncbi:MAG: hypothetical protein L3J07_02575 [Candidatus Magasanikbacteria bacterium]|nr:hypothetical protein [Candidatus Magasanikbacteria bacterium]
MLTNKSIANELGFSNLYNLYSLRTWEINELIKKDFDRLGINDLAKLCIDFKNRNYNKVLTTINKSGFKLIKIEDQETVSNFFNELIIGEIDCIKAVGKAFENKFVKKTSSYNYYIENKDEFLRELSIDKDYHDRKTSYKSGNTTAKQMKVDKELFNEFLRKYNKELFYFDLFKNKKVSFKEIINYQEYIDENIKSEYITMHKTKGGEIENVMIVLDEFFWNQYDFQIIFSDEELEKKLKNQKLFYVACSRAVKNLICIKLIKEDEENNLLNYFSNYEKI